MFDADMLCDQVALLHRGKIIAVNNPDALKLKYGSPKVKVTYTNPAEEETFDLQTLCFNEKFTSILKNNRIRTIHYLVGLTFYLILITALLKFYQKTQ